MNNNNSLLGQIDLLALAGVGLAIWSLFLAYKNMSDNIEQTEILKQHLDNQDNDYLKTSIEQNEQIIQQNEEILQKL
jgi:hypothetical protein